MTNILKRIGEESAGKMSAVAATAILLLVSIAALVFITGWTSAFVSQPYNQDNSPSVVFGNASGSVGDLNALDGATWNVTAGDIELGLKTVEFFIGQDNSTGIASGTTKSWPASIYLPEDDITVDSAIIEISMMPGATDISAGSVDVNGKNSTAIPLLQSTGETLRILYRYNATDALANFTKGTNTFILNVVATGPVIYQENAKLILTYRYDRNSELQLKTVRFFSGSDGTSKAPASDTTSNFKVNLPEVSPNVKSAWIENSASITATSSTTSTFSLSIDGDYHLSGLTSEGTINTHDILVLYNATPFYLLGQGWSPQYSLKMRSVAGENLNLFGAEAVLTYTYNHTATMSRTSQKTVRYFAGANTSLITAGSVTNFTFDIRIPEDEAMAESVWFRIASDTGVADNTFTVNVNGSWAQDFLYDWNGETAGMTPILANGTDALKGLSQGSNNVTLSIANSASTTSALSAEAIVTYNYSASSRTQQESVQYRVYQSFGEANTANIVKTGNFSVNMPATSINVTSAYLQTDPTISNTGTSLAGATSTGYGTWLNGSGSSFSVVTSDENLNTRALLNATKVYGSEAMMAGKTSSWGANLIAVDENNYAHSAKFILTYAYDRKSRAEVVHNSTAASYQSPIESVNATLRFMSATTAWWNLTIYDWPQQEWSECNSSQVYANSWNTWHCNITSPGYAPSSYVSADKIVKINMNSTNLTLTSRLMEDYVRFDLTTDAPPTWEGVSSSIASTYSPATLSHFNISWGDDKGVSAVLLESNYSGTPTNYTMSHVGNGNYTFNATMPAGTYYWRSYANDTVNQWNASAAIGVVIAKAGNRLHTVLNGNTDDNRTITYGGQSSASASSDDGQTVVLYFDGAVAASPHVATLGAATYNYTAYSAGNANYTSNSTIYFLTVQKASSASITTYVNSAMPDQDSTVIYGTTTNVTATVPLFAQLSIYRNGTLVSSASGTSVLYFAPLSAGFYNFTVVSEADANITSASSSTRYQYVNRAPLGIVFSSDTGYGSGGGMNVVFSSGTEYTSGENVTQVVFLTFANGTYIPGASCLLDIYNITFLDKAITNASMTEVPSTGLYWYKNNTITAEGIYTSWVNCTYGGDSAYASRTFHIAPWANTITTMDARTSQIQNTVGSGNGAVTIWNLTQQTNLTAQEINRTLVEMNRTLHQLNDSIRATVVPKIDLALGNLTEIRALAIEINNTVWHIDLAHLGNYSLSTLTDEIRLNRDQLTSLKAKLDTEAEFSKESVFLVTDSVNSVNDALQQIEAGNIATARLSLDTAAKSMAKAAEAYALESDSATVVRTPPAGNDDNKDGTIDAASGLTGSYRFFLAKTKITQVVQILAYIIVSAILGVSLFHKMKPLNKGKTLAKKYAFDRILPYISPGGWREVGGSIGLALSGTSSKLRKGKRVKRARTKAKHVRAKPGVWEDDDQEGVGNSGE